MTNAPGADDNGTGTAGTLELARALVDVDLETTVIFVAFSAEELGLWGSASFSGRARAMDMNITLMLNMDMIGYTDDAEPDVLIRADAQSRNHAEITQDLFNTQTTLIPSIGHSSSNSDHYFFQQNGYPALFIQEGDFNTPHYHSPSDLIDYIDFPYALQVLEGMMTAIVHFSETPEPPGGLIAIEPGDGASQIIEWEENQEPDIAGYNLYSGASSGEYTKVRAVTTTSDTLTDLNENEDVYVAVSAIDADGNESLLSPEIAFNPRNIPVTPAALSSTSETERVLLTWEANNREADLAGYVITRTDPDGNITSFTVDVDVTEFSDTSLQPHRLYHYTVQARDMDDNLSPVSDEALGQLATHDKGIIIVDGTSAGTAQPLRPADATVDLYYESVLRNFNAGVQWDLQDSSAAGRQLSDADLAVYSTVIWHSDVIFGPRSLTLDTLAMKKYLRNGGQLLLSGWRLFSNLSADNQELITFSEGSFGHDVLNIDTVRTSQITLQDFSGADPVNAGFPNIDVDPQKSTMSGGNLMAMESILSFADDQFAEVVYRYRSSTQPPSEFDGMPVAAQCMSDSGRFMIFDFPLFFMKKDQAEALLTHALEAFGELPTGIDSDDPLNAQLPSENRLYPNYPNPFNPETTIRYQLAQAGDVDIAVYNISGQRVRRLASGSQPAGVHEVQWNGLGDDGRPMSSGVYLVRLRSGATVQTMKVMMMK
jgi:hypothetical protein